MHTQQTGEHQQLSPQKQYTRSKASYVTSAFITLWHLELYPGLHPGSLLHVTVQGWIFYSSKHCLTSPFSALVINLSILQMKEADPLIRSSCSLSLRYLWLFSWVHLGKTGIVMEGKQGQPKKCGQMLSALTKMICDWITLCLCQEPAR